MNLIASILIGILCTIGSYFAGHYLGDKDGYARRDTETVIQIAKLNAENQEKTNTLVQQMSDKEEELQQEKDNAKKQIAKLNSDLATNKLQFYVKVKPSTNTNCPNAPSSSGSDTDVAILDPKVSETLVALTDEGDTGIRKLNACIATYETVRRMINGPTTTK